MEERFAWAARQLDRRGIEKQVYQRMLRKEPNNVLALNNLAACLNHEGNHTAALRRFEKAAQLSPTDRIVRLNLQDTVKLVANAKGKTAKR